MATTKYIVNNASGQAIDGNITINGGITVTGPSNGLVTYKALLTQLGVQNGTSLNDFNDGLIIGETYTITDYSPLGAIVSDFIVNNSGTNYVDGTYPTNTSGNGLGLSVNVITGPGGYIDVLQIDNPGQGYNTGDTFTIDDGGIGSNAQFTITQISYYDDFSNIANVISGEINKINCQFIATGEIPTNWNNGSNLESSGNLVVKVLENNLGYDIEWVTDFMSPGFYLGFNKTTGPLYNTFNRNSTFIQSGNKIPTFGPFILDTFILPYNANEKDDSIVIVVFDLSGPAPVPDNLYYYPVEIQILQDTDTAPTIISGTTTSFPFTNVSIDFYCGDMFIQSFYTSGGTIVNNISEVVTILNTDTNTSFLGTFSDDGGNIILTMAKNLETQFCANSTLTFDVFND